MTGLGYLVQIYLVQIYGMSIFMKCEDFVLKFGFDFGFVSLGFVSFRLVSFRFDFVSHFTGTPLSIVERSVTPFGERLDQPKHMYDANNNTCIDFHLHLTRPGTF
jgi:hypothetical protein